MQCLLIIFTQFLPNPLLPYPLNIISSYLLLFLKERQASSFTSHISLGVGHSLELSWLSRSHTLKEKWTPFPSSYTLSIAPELEVELRALLLWAGICLMWACKGLVITAVSSLCDFPVMLKRKSFLCSCLPFWLLQSILLPPPFLQW